MAMNIAKLQAQLQHVPDQALVGYVQNPDGQVPSYLALAELQRRKEIRQAGVPKQAPTSRTVAQQEVAQVEPGVAALPLPQDMYSEESFAQGGIVAFADGGVDDNNAVVNYMQQAMGGKPAPQDDLSTNAAYGYLSRINPMMGNGANYGTPAPQDDLSSNPGAQYLRMAGVLPPLATAQPTPAPTGLLGGTSLNLNSDSGARFAQGGDVKHFAKGDFVKSYNAYQNYLTDPDQYDPYATSSAWERLAGPSPKSQYELAKAQELTRLASLPGTPGPFQVTTPAERQAYENRYKLIRAFGAGAYDPTAQNNTGGPYAPPNMDPVAIAERNKQLLQNRFNLKDVKGDTNIKGNKGAKTEFPPSAADAGIARLTYTGPSDISAEYETLLRPEESAQAAMNRYKQLIGVDPNQAKIQDRLAAMEAKTAKEEESAPWMALAKAGFAMAGGKSPRAISNIAEGAQAGIADLAAAKDKINSAKERQFEMSSRLAAAQRAEQVAAATYGLQSEERVKAHNDVVKQAKLGYKADLAMNKAKGEFEAQKGNLEADISQAKLAEDSAWHKLQYNADRARTNVLGANAQFTKEQAQATNLLKQIMAPKIAALKNAGYAEEDAYDAVYPEALAKLPPNMLSALGYTNDFVKGMGTPTAQDYIKRYNLTPKPTK